MANQKTLLHLQNLLMKNIEGDNMTEFTKKKYIYIPWAEKREDFIKQYGEIKGDEVTIAKRWDELENFNLLYLFLIGTYL